MLPPLARAEQHQKTVEDTWETETIITTIDLDEIETDIEFDCFVSALDLHQIIVQIVFQVTR